MTEHITQEGERWDHLSHKYYGDATLYEPIVMANPEIGIDPILPAGKKVRIPDIDKSSIVKGLPPWKK